MATTPRTFLAMFGVVLVTAAPAVGDTEGSEHTVALIGAEADTLGVTVAWDDATGWSMTARPKPGATAVTTRLTALGTAHVHYLAYVAPGRTSVTFIEHSAGRAPGAKDAIARVYALDGKLVRSWRFDEVVSPRDLKHTRASISHFAWSTDGFTLTRAGLALTTRATKRKVVLAPDASAFK